MSESSPFGDESEIRVEFVQAIFSAMTDNDAAKLNDLLRSGVTTAEYVEAMNLYGAGATSVPGLRPPLPRPPICRSGTSRPSSC